MSFRGGLFFLCVGLVMACAAMPPPPPAPVRRTTMELELGSVRLPNGLRVVRVHDPRAREVTVTMRYAVGAADDPPGQEGIAHLVEHLMFEQVVGSQSINAKLDSISREHNAFTSYDSTTYVTSAPAAQLEALLFIEFIRMNLRCASITESVFVREREVVLQELRLRNKSVEMLAAMHRGAFSETHPYGRQVGGTAESVGGLTLKQACAFADAHYGPTNAVLVVTGNFEPSALESALAKHLAKVPRRTLVAQTPIQRSAPSRVVKAMAPISDDAVLVTWQLPADAEQRTRILAVASVVADYIDSAVMGRVTRFQLGGERAPLFAVVIEPAEDETILDVQNALPDALARAPQYFQQLGVWGRMLFDRMRQTAIHNQFETLEGSWERDASLAAQVYTGVEPQAALNGALQALATMSPTQASKLIEQNLSAALATVVVLQASEKTRGTTKLTTTQQPVHDEGVRRDTDPALATQPASEPLLPAPTGMVTRTLGNGMRIVLLPMTSVPVVDVRMVFNSGTADELDSARGAGIVAAYALSIGRRYTNDLLALAESGGVISGIADFDRTTFATVGLDMHLDYMLAGMRRHVREGTYVSAQLIVQGMRLMTKTIDDDGARTDAWRSALYGAQHPYRLAGMPRHMTPSLGAADIDAFRRAHYTPDNATLIVAGRFDVALANKWIDYLFADWSGTKAARNIAPSKLEPISLAVDEDVAQTIVRIALPATTGTRAQQLVATEMLGSIARDVRHQLGASYELDADIVDLPQAKRYTVIGTIDASRTSDALALIAERLGKLRSDPDVGARAFVEARRRVLAQLSDITNTASNLAYHASDDVVAGRTPLSDATAREVHDLTLAQMTGVLGELDLARAAIVMAGPTAELDKAYAALGRTPRRVTSKENSPRTAASDAPNVFPDAEEIYLHEIEDALTLQRRRRTLSAGVFAGYATGKVLQHGGISGPRIGGSIGLRLDQTLVVGIRGSFSTIDGTFDRGSRFVPMLEPIDATIGSVGIFAQANGYDRLYGSLQLSLNVDKTRAYADSVNGVVESGWGAGLSVGLEAGVDIVKLGVHRFGLMIHLEGELASAAGWAGLSAGIGYRLF